MQIKGIGRHDKRGRFQTRRAADEAELCDPVLDPKAPARKQNYKQLGTEKESEKSLLEEILTRIGKLEENCQPKKRRTAKSASTATGLNILREIVLRRIKNKAAFRQETSL